MNFDSTKTIALFNRFIMVPSSSGRIQIHLPTVEVALISITRRKASSRFQYRGMLARL